jgi:putative addiction module component (TIGR02574 family)
MRNLENLLAEALDLPEQERAHLAHELLRSLDQEGAESAEQVMSAWTDELARRLQDVRDGDVALVELDDVERHVAQRLAAVRR